MVHKHERAICCVPNCSSRRWTVGRCATHSRELKQNLPDEFERLRLLPSEDANHEFYLTKHGLPHPKWEYAGKEHELISAQETDNGQ